MRIANIQILGVNKGRIIISNGHKTVWERNFKMIDDRVGTFIWLGVEHSYNIETEELTPLGSTETTEKTKNITIKDNIKEIKNFTEEQSEFNINERFSFLENFTDMVINDLTPSLLVCGEGGLGKTHSVTSKINSSGFQEDIDYVIIKGYSTPKALYATLYENQNKLIVFDDCDSVLKDPISLNILKGALDNYKTRTISWLSKGFANNDLPSSFNFTGRVIFISNLTLSKMDGAVRSRTLSVDLTMTLKDKIERMRAIVNEIEPNYSMDIKLKVLDFLDKNKENAKEFNMRTFEKSIKVLDFYTKSKTEEEGFEALKYLLVNA